LIEDSGPRLYRFAVDTLSQAAADLKTARVRDRDIVLIVPRHSGVIITEPEQLTKAVERLGGVCVVASAGPVASPTGGGRPPNQPHPHILLGRAAATKALLAAEPDGANDADWLRDSLRYGRPDLVLDTASQLLYIVDGVEATVIAGRVYTNGNRPLVLVDPKHGGRASAFHVTGAPRVGDLEMRHLPSSPRNGSQEAEAVESAPDVLSTALWTPEVCGDLIRAAETAALLSAEPPEMAQARREGSAHIFDLVEADLDERIRPLLQAHWPDVRISLLSALVVRSHPGDVAGGVLGRDLIVHQGPAHLVSSVRLNERYQGGSLTLPRQGWQDSSMPVGAVSAWPSSSWSHPYRAAPVSMGVKYRLAILWGPRH
jgi:hypothetical protein